MTDILTVLPLFSTAPFTHLLPSLSKAAVTTSEILTLPPIDIARRAQLPPAEVSKLADAVLEALHSDLYEAPLAPWQSISLLDETLDESLGGGIPAGYLTEITGERYGPGSSIEPNLCLCLRQWSREDAISTNNAFVCATTTAMWPCKIRNLYIH
jgi:Rad51